MTLATDFKIGQDFGVREKAGLYCVPVTVTDVLEKSIKVQRYRLGRFETIILPLSQIELSGLNEIVIPAWLYERKAFNK